MQRILAALDFSPTSADVLALARTLAGRFEARLWLIHVVAPDADFVDYEVGPKGARDASAEELASEQRRLQESAEELRRDGIDASPVLARGPTVERLVTEAALRDADLVIVGSHGRGPLARLLLGSVSEGLLRQAPCPVLVVPPGGEEG